MCGDLDQGMPFAFHEVLHKNIPHSELIVIQQAGHFITLEQPDEVNRYIADFIKSENKKTTNILS